MKFVDVTNDIAFRKIFGNENKKKSLISFLNAVINLPENEHVADVEIANPINFPTSVVANHSRNDSGWM